MSKKAYLESTIYNLKSAASAISNPPTDDLIEDCPIAD